MLTKVGKIRRLQWPTISQTALARSLGDDWTQTKVSLIEAGKVAITPVQEKLILEMISRLHAYDLEVRDQLSKLKLPKPPVAEIKDRRDDTE